MMKRARIEVKLITAKLEAAMEELEMKSARVRELEAKLDSVVSVTTRAIFNAVPRPAPKP